MEVDEGFQFAIAPNNDVDFRSGWNTKNIKKKRKILEELLGRTRGKKLRRQVKARYECARWLQPTSTSHFLAFRKKKRSFELDLLKRRFLAKHQKKMSWRQTQVCAMRLNMEDWTHKPHRQGLFSSNAIAKTFNPWRDQRVSNGDLLSRESQSSSNIVRVDVWVVNQWRIWMIFLR